MTNERTTYFTVAEVKLLQAVIDFKTNPKFPTAWKTTKDELAKREPRLTALEAQRLLQMMADVDKEQDFLELRDKLYMATKDVPYWRLKKSW